eukprot:758969-Hanusia_phi.AAC.5
MRGRRGVGRRGEVQRGDGEQRRRVVELQNQKKQEEQMLREKKAQVGAEEFQGRKAEGQRRAGKSIMK